MSGNIEKTNGTNKFWIAISCDNICHGKCLVWILIIFQSAIIGGDDAKEVSIEHSHGCRSS
jgi:hypothetical protein